MQNNLVMTSSPHLRDHSSTQRIMQEVCLALLPAGIAGVIIFGWSALMLICVSVATCVLSEFVWEKLTKRTVTIGDWSAVVTGLLLAFNLPSSIPWWIVVIGSLVAIGVAKMTFGGLGRNPFNPALVGRVFLLIAYPVQMTTFTAPVVEGYADAMSGATPLAAIKAGVPVEDVDLLSMFSGTIPGSLGEVAAAALIVGGIYLLWRRVITWHIPVAVLGTMAVFAFFVALADGGGALLYQLPAFHVLAGGALLGAIFMATDYVTSPMTHKGMIIYGIGIGAVTMIIRLWGSYPEGMSFAILLMNAVTPLINKYVKPVRFGLAADKK